MKEATLQKKIKVVSGVAEKIRSSEAQIVVDCIGLNVAQVTSLRRQLFAQDCHFEVIKNNTILRAAEEANIKGLEQYLSGPTAVAFSKDAGKTAKIIYDFAKKNSKLKIKAGVVDGQVMNSADLKVFSALPNKEGMLSMLLSVLQAPVRNLAYAVKSVAEQNA
ncbi:MAG: 50S ribosomal protein L10 [Bacilli bacterium]